MINTRDLIDICLSHRRESYYFFFLPSSFVRANRQSTLYRLREIRVCRRVRTGGPKPRSKRWPTLRLPRSRIISGFAQKDSEAPGPCECCTTQKDRQKSIFHRRPPMTLRLKLSLGLILKQPRLRFIQTAHIIYLYI